MNRAPFPWREAIAFGLGVLKLSPRDFWGMTARELALAVEGASGRAHPALDGVGLRAMMARFPDSEPK